MKKLVILCCLCCGVLRLHSQGYIVPNGVVVNFDGSFSPGEIDVLHNPSDPTSGGSYTGFILSPVSSTAFQFDPVVDVGVRVFLVSLDDPISLQPILSMNYTELTYPNDYVFNLGIPVYVGLYTGNQQFAPPNGIYGDPLFGWAELENVGGAIQLINSALEYQGGGIYAGTDLLIPAPEPGTGGLILCGAVLFGLKRWRKALA
jgi:predicted outer membrane repeat protein